MRFASFALAAVMACGPFDAGPPGPKAAAERAAAERKDSTEEPIDDDGKSWGGWRYRGARDECFFVVERECFGTLEEACDVTECKAGCTSRGAGPAVVYCK